jgi:4-amino-4-deoxy-L-arabinose transferase-like glycosyltransferase
MRRHALFFGLFLLIAAARFVVLLMSQTPVHSDEAIIGLMAKHIFEGRYFPFYMYGQPYWKSVQKPHLGVPVKLKCTD